MVIIVHSGYWYSLQVLYALIHAVRHLISQVSSLSDLQIANLSIFRI